MYILLVLSVLSYLASLGHSLQCVFCVASVGTSCSGNSITCPDGSVCGYVYTEITEVTSTQMSNVFKRSCIEEDQCNTTGSITLADGRVKTAISCCNTDDCEPPPPTFPVDDNDKQNGITCRSCSSANSDWCYTSDTIECTGNETMCVLQSTTISGIVSLRTAIRGCATRSICDLGIQRAEFGGSRAVLEFVCTDKASDLQQKSSTFGLLVLVFLGLFY